MPQSRFVVAFALTASAALATAPTATAADYPKVEIIKQHLQYGATYMTGEVAFYNRSAGVDGVAHIVGCRTIFATTINLEATGKEEMIDERSTSRKCDGDFPVHLNVPADIAGGADRVYLELRDGDGKSFNPLVDMKYRLR
ncbi:hypothetical protein [Lentzea sp.]|uniref:hypothetical protein n=1 Tax=Lentzea sp. TaxID=56099 RepID=UPI002ED37CB8